MCNECASLLRRSLPSGRLCIAAALPLRCSIDSTSRTFTRAYEPGAYSRRRRRRPLLQPQTIRRLSTTLPRAAQETSQIASPEDHNDTLARDHHRINELSASALKIEDNQLPTEQRVLYVLEQLDAIAKSLTNTKTVLAPKRARPNEDSTATSALLGSVNTRRAKATLSRASLLSQISGQAEAILRDPNVFITSSILQLYVNLQTSLQQPSSLAEIFDLYAYKPRPTLTRSGQIEYTPTSPNKISAAIPAPTADAALTSAIASHDLTLCLDIIDTSYATTAYRRAKTLRQAFLPFSGLAIAPFAAYALSVQFANFQYSMSTSQAQGIAFAGIMTYITTVTTLGYVVITTSNDQMIRVTWVRGVPLWERWVREDERAALDRVAMKWGFQSENRRGEEEGEDWEALRETCGVRGMGLDQSHLLEGME